MTSSDNGRRCSHKLILLTIPSFRWMGQRILQPSSLPRPHGCQKLLDRNPCCWNFFPTPLSFLTNLGTTNSLSEGKNFYLSGALGGPCKYEEKYQQDWFSKSPITETTGSFTCQMNDYFREITRNSINQKLYQLSPKAGSLSHYPSFPHIISPFLFEKNLGLVFLFHPCYPITAFIFSLSF